MLSLSIFLFLIRSPSSLLLILFISFLIKIFFRLLFFRFNLDNRFKLFHLNLDFLIFIYWFFYLKVWLFWLFWLLFKFFFNLFDLISHRRIFIHIVWWRLTLWKYLWILSFLLIIICFFLFFILCFTTFKLNLILNFLYLLYVHVLNIFLILYCSN